MIRPGLTPSFSAPHGVSATQEHAQTPTQAQISEQHFPGEQVEKNALSLSVDELMAQVVEKNQQLAEREKAYRSQLAQKDAEIQRLTDMLQMAWQRLDRERERNSSARVDSG